MGNVDNNYIIEVEGYDVAIPAIPKAEKPSAKLVKASTDYHSGSSLKNYYYDTGYLRHYLENTTNKIIMKVHRHFGCSGHEDYIKAREKSRENNDEKRTIYTTTFQKIYIGKNHVSGKIDTRYHNLSDLQKDAIEEFEDDDRMGRHERYAKDNKCPYKECIVCKRKPKFWRSIATTIHEDYNGVASAIHNGGSEVLSPEERTIATYKDKFNHTKYIKSKLHSEHQHMPSTPVLKCGHTTRTPHRDFMNLNSINSNLSLNLNPDEDTFCDSLAGWNQGLVYTICVRGHELSTPSDDVACDYTQLRRLRQKLHKQKYLDDYEVQDNSKEKTKLPPYSISFDEKKRIAEIACKRLLTRARTSNLKRNSYNDIDNPEKIGTKYDHSQVKLSDIDRSDECILLQKLAGSIITYDDIKPHLNDILIHIVTILARHVPTSDTDFKLESWKLGTNTTEFPDLYDLDEYYLAIEDKSKDMKAVMEMLNS